jgi:hypothetical protein
MAAVGFSQIRGDLPKDKLAGKCLCVLWDLQKLTSALYKLVGFPKIFDL